MLHTDGRSRLGSDVHLGIALTLETRGEGEQVWVMALGQCRDGGGVNTAGKERAYGHIGTHVLLDAILQRPRNLVEKLLFLSLLDGLDGEAGGEVALSHYFFARVQRDGAAGLDATNVGMQRLRFRNVLQVDVVLDGALIKA